MIKNCYVECYAFKGECSDDLIGPVTEEVARHIVEAFKSSGKVIVGLEFLTGKWIPWGIRIVRQDDNGPEILLSETPKISDPIQLDINNGNLDP